MKRNDIVSLDYFQFMVYNGKNKIKVSYTEDNVMAFCGNCGKEVPDGEVCSCTSAAQSTATAQPASVSNQPKGNNSILLLAAAAVVVIVVIGIIIFAVGGSKGYMGPIKDFVKAVNKEETDRIELRATLMPDFGAKQLKAFYKKALKSDDIADSQEDYIEQYEEYYEDCEDEFDNWKLSFELEEAERMDDDDLDDLKDYYEDYYDDYLEDEVEFYEEILDDDDDLEDFADDGDISEGEAKAMLKAAIKYYKKYEKVKVTDAYEIEGKFIVKSGKKEYETDDVTLLAVKANGDWFYAGITDGEIVFEDDDEDCFRFVRSLLRSDAFFASGF